MITSLIGGFKEYTSIVDLFNGKSNHGSTSLLYNMYTVVYFIYDNIGDRPQVASAAAVVLLIIIMIFTIFQKTVRDKSTHY